MYTIIKCTDKSLIGKTFKVNEINKHIDISNGSYAINKISTIQDYDENHRDVFVFDLTNLIIYAVKE